MVYVDHHLSFSHPPGVVMVIGLVGFVLSRLNVFPKNVAVFPARSVLVIFNLAVVIHAHTSGVVRVYCPLFTIPVVKLVLKVTQSCAKSILIGVDAGLVSVQVFRMIVYVDMVDGVVMLHFIHSPVVGLVIIIPLGAVLSKMIFDVSVLALTCVQVFPAGSLKLIVNGITHAVSPEIIVVVAVHQVPLPVKVAT